MAFISAPDPNQPGSALFDPANLGHISLPATLANQPNDSALAALSGFGREISALSLLALAAPPQTSGGAAGGSVGYPH